MPSVLIWRFLHAVVHSLGSSGSAHSSSSSLSGSSNRTIVLEVSASSTSDRHRHRATGLCPWSLASLRVVGNSSSISSHGTRDSRLLVRVAPLSPATVVASRGIWRIHVGCALMASSGLRHTMLSWQQGLPMICSSSTGSSHDRVMGMWHRDSRSSHTLMRLS